MHELIKTTEYDIDTLASEIAGQLAPSSRRVYMSDARHFAEWMKFQGLTPQTMTRVEMSNYRLHLADSTYAKATKQRMFAVACKLMREQKLNGRLDIDVTDELKGFKVDADETTHTALSKQQAKDMLAIDTSTTQGKRDYALLSLLVKTGVRRSEAVALNQGDIRMMDGHHVAVIEHGKGDKTRVVKLRVEVYRAIAEYLAALPATGKQAPLFVRIRRGDHPTSSRLTDKAVELIVKKYAPDGVDLTPHGLRATFATLALENGAPLHDTQYAMGHKDPRTTERYQKRKLHLDHNAVDYLNF